MKLHRLESVGIVLIGSAIIIAPFSNEEKQTDYNEVTVKEVKDKADLNKNVKADSKENEEGY